MFVNEQLSVFLPLSPSKLVKLGNCMESEGVVPLNNATFDPKMVNHSIDIYFFTASPPSRATLMLVKALGLKHRVKNVNLMAGEHMTPEFLKMNPLHTVPVLNDNGFVLWDSHVIMKYLVDQYAKDDSFFPRDAKKAAIVTHRLFFEATYLFPTFQKYIVSQEMKHLWRKCLKTLFLAHPGPVLSAGMQPDPAQAEKCEEALKILNDLLKGQTWVAGENMTIADFSIIAVISTADAIGFKLSKYENLDQWFQNTKNVMNGFGYNEINQPGVEAFAAGFYSKLSN